jgi:acyl carrier protein
MAIDPSLIEEKVKQLIQEQIGCDASATVLTAHLIDDIGMDSLDCVELSMAVEEAFEIEVPDEDTDAIATVKDAVEYVKRRLAK